MNGLLKVLLTNNGLLAAVLTQHVSFGWYILQITNSIVLMEMSSLNFDKLILIQTFV